MGISSRDLRSAIQVKAGERVSNEQLILKFYTLKFNDANVNDFRLSRFYDYLTLSIYNE